MSERIIDSIDKGWGEGAICYSVGCSCDEIKEEWKNVGPGSILVYCGYKDGQIVFEIEANSSLTIRYKQEVKA